MKNNSKRTKLTLRQIRGTNNFLNNCLKYVNSDELAQLYRSSKIRHRGQIGQDGKTVLKGHYVRTVQNH